MRAEFGTRPDGFNTNPRILAVALRGASGGYRLAFQNHHLIARREFPNQEDSFDGPDALAVAAGKLKIALWRFMNAGGWDAARPALHSPGGEEGRG